MPDEVAAEDFLRHIACLHVSPYALVTHTVHHAKSLSASFFAILRPHPPFPKRAVLL